MLLYLKHRPRTSLTDLFLQIDDGGGDILDVPQLRAMLIDSLAIPNYEFHRPQNNVVEAIVVLYLELSNGQGYLDLPGDYTVLD